MIAVFNGLVRETADLIVGQIRVVEEYTICIQLLLGMRYEQAPVGVELIIAAKTETSICCVIHIIFGNVGIVSVDKGHA